MAGTERWDAVIAGAGASGLSLAAHLAASPWSDRRVLVVDDGSHALTGRAWAFWSLGAGLLGDAVAATYDSFLVHAGGEQTRVRLRQHRYRVVRGGDLLRVARRRLAAAPGFVLRRGHVDAVRDCGEGAELVVDGCPVATRWAFDSIGTPEAVPGQAPVDLSFVGWEVQATRDAFDPALPTLMDFRIPQQGEVRFIYVLPSGPRRALVELTRFGAAEPAAEATPAAYLSDVLDVGDHTVIRREQGRLPLRIAEARKPAGAVLPIGLRGGMLKASTGYAYARIQRDSAAITASLVGYGDPHHLPAPSSRHRYLDAVLLELVAGDPGRVEGAFARLFGRNDGDLVLRFLDERTTAPEEARLVATLPRLPFVRAAARQARRARAARMRR